MKPDDPHPDDPFAGRGPQPVRCRWLSPEDQARAHSAKVIRLVVDVRRWEMHRPNAAYQRNVMRDVAAFIGPTRAIVVTPAGMVTTTISRLEGDMASVLAGIDAGNEALGRLDFGPSLPEMLLGQDACLPDEATPLQSMVYLAGERRRATTANTTFKLYPNNGESASLASWLWTQAAGDVPADLVPARRVKTAAGVILVLVCHDACLFSARSRANLTDQPRLRIREHFERAATAEPRPAFALLATHLQDSNYSGGIFKNAASVLAEEFGVTAVTTMFTPSEILDDLARRFPTRGERANEIVTLLVEDTWEGG